MKAESRKLKVESAHSCDVGAVIGELRARGEMALVPYVTGGFPTLSKSMDALRVMSDAGADVLEVGIPFCDPVADGPTIQAASQAALDQGVRLADILSALRDVRVCRPVVLMSYLNPLCSYSMHRLFADMRDAGASGLIVPDLPPEEAGEWLKAAREAGVGLVFLAAPTSPPDRLRLIADSSDAFVYYVSVTGTTGTRRALPSGLAASLQGVRAITDKPVVVGFGISEAAQVRALRGQADGVVVGSRIVEALRGGEDLGTLIGELKEATRS